MTTKTATNDRDLHEKRLALDALIKGRELIADYRKWCVGATARNARNKSVPSDSKHADSWCGYGAAARNAHNLSASITQSYFVSTTAVALLDKEAEKLGYKSVIAANDNTKPLIKTKETHALILSLYDNAIDQAKKELCSQSIHQPYG